MDKKINNKLVLTLTGLLLINATGFFYKETLHTHPERCYFQITKTTNEIVISASTQNLYNLNFSWSIIAQDEKNNFKL